MRSLRFSSLVIWMAVLPAAMAARCSSGTTTLLAPTEQRCAMTVSPGSTTAEAGGGPGALTVSTSRECQWTVSTTAAWIQLNSSSGQGPGTVSYQISENQSPTPRSGVVSIGDLRATIAQSGISCSFSVSPATITVGPAGGDLLVSLSTDDSCPWAAAPPAPWLAVVPATGTGSADLHLQVAANAGAERHGVVTVGNASIALDQTAPPVESQTCPISLSPSASSISAAGGSLITTVTTSTGCAWTTSTGVSWIRISGQPGGSGVGSLSITVDPNPGVARTASVTISGATLTISQAGAGSAPPIPIPCTFTVSPAGFTGVASTASTLNLNVTTQAGCTWTATSNQGWISIAQGGSRSGNGSVSLNVQQNPAGPRSGSVVVAGQMVAISQLGVPGPCTYTIAPTSYSAPAAGGTLQVTVTTASNCAWTVTGNPAWTGVTPASGTGNGTIAVTVQSSGAGRNATLTIATQSFVVTQAGAAPCSYAINPNTMNGVAASGGTASVVVTTTTGCSWTVSGNPPWIAASQANGSGSGNTTITVQANTGTARSASFQIAGQSFSVGQLAPAPPCTYTTSPGSFNLSSAAQTRTISVSTQSTCTSNATATVSWIHITATPPDGGGNVTFDVDRNNDHGSRTGIVTVTGQSFSNAITVAQGGR